MGMKKVLQKKFTSFEKEEQWLNELASCGWLLVDYSKDDFSETTYTFEQHKRAKSGHYKIDFVTFRNRADFEDYKALLEESGWDFLAKNEYYAKLILFSTDDKVLFSDQASQIMRDVRKRRAAIRLAITLLILDVLAALAYLKFDYDILMVFAFGWLAGGLYYTFITCKLTVRIRKERLA